MLTVQTSQFTTRKFLLQSRPCKMAKSCAALLLVGLMLASLCVASAARVPDRKLLLGDTLGDLLGGVLDLDSLEIQLDLSAVSVSVAPGKAKLVDLDVAVDLEAGKVNKLIAANVQVVDGSVSVELAIWGIDKVVVLDLKKLKPTLRRGKLVAVVVFVVDEVKHVLHLRDEDGHCALLDIDISKADFSVSETGSSFSFPRVVVRP